MEALYRLNNKRILQQYVYKYFRKAAMPFLLEAAGGSVGDIRSL